MDQLNLADVDVDGAVQEAAAALEGETRSGFLRKAAMSGGALAERRRAARDSRSGPVSARPPRPLGSRMGSVAGR